jgi:hypothetical protein
VRERTLVHPKQGARGPQLRCGDQCGLHWIDVLNINYHILQIHYNVFRRLAALFGECERIC